MKILGFCGSQRENSSNKALLRAARKFLCHHHWEEFNIFDIPFFDPALQYSSDTPEIVLKLRKSAAEADLIFFTTPEYAHSAPGVLKNAFEWMFFEGTQKKPVAFIIGSGQGEHTVSQLIETLSTMDFSIDASRVLLIQGIQMKIDKNDNFTDDTAKNSFEKFLSSMTNEN